MLSLKSLIIAGAVAVSLLVAPAAPTMASVKGHASKNKVTVVAHKKAHKHVAKKAAHHKVTVKKAHKGVAVKAHKKA